MTNTMKWLGGALIVQLLLVAVTLTSHAGFERQVPQGALLSFDKNTIDTIKISDSLETLELVKNDAGIWTVPALESLPADPNLVLEAVGRLQDLNKSWPLTTTSSAHDRFAVANDAFERKVELLAGEKRQAGLMLGDSPGFRKVHVRVLDEDPVYSLELNSFDFPVEPEHWLDKSLLAVDDLRQVEGEDFTLTKIGVDWQLLLDETVTPHDEAKVNQLVRVIGDLRVTGIAESPISDDAEITELKVTGGEGTYTLVLASDGDQYWATRSDNTILFSVNQYPFKQMAAATALGLQVQEETAELDNDNNDSAEQNVADGESESPAS